MTTEELKNAAGFKAVDAEGNDLGVVTLSDIVTAVKEELAQSQPAARAASVSTLSEVSTLAATDTYEDQLPQKTDVNWVRGLDAEGNPVLISKQSLASVVEELLQLNRYLKMGQRSISSFEIKNAVFPGVYHVDNNTDKSEAPEGSYGFGILMNLTAGDFYAQVYFPNTGSVNTNGIYIRTKFGTANNTAWIHLK